MTCLATPARPNAAGVLPMGPMPLFDLTPTRYACYPTADRFTPAFGPEEARRALQERGRTPAIGGCRPLSLDLHLARASSRSSHAALRSRLRGLPQVAAIEQEIALATAASGRRPAVSGLRLGGPAASTLDAAVLESLLETIADTFSLADDVALAIEVDPATASPARLSQLHALGFRRLAFDLRRPGAAVQANALRLLMQRARGLGFGPTVARLAYGFPAPRPGVLPPDVGAIAALRPDRVQLEPRAGAHRPAKPSCVGPGAPRVQARGICARAVAIDSLLRAGYVHVGMDQFALPADALAVARRQGRCHVEVDGVHQRCPGDRLGLGPSAVSRIGHSYYRNAARTADYLDALRQGRLPVEAGVRMSRDDLVRRTLIHALIGNGSVDFEAIELAHLICVPTYFADELGRLSELAKAGIIEMDAHGIELTARGDHAACAVAMAFDRCRAEATPS